MIKFTTVAETLLAVRNASKHGLTIGFVPTMGYLHKGHRSLIERARRENDRVIVSIFVNPTQFGPQEDFASYPRDLARDMDLCQSAGADWIFAPAVEEMYPEPSRTTIDIAGLGDHLCGARRPGHFRGVCLVVTKLFGICQPTRAYFGEKDAQQLAIIRRMTLDLNLPVEIVGCPIIREPDGLALSSRNSYLSPAERQAALIVPRTLAAARAALEAGEAEIAAVIARMAGVCNKEPLARADYLSVVDSQTLQPVEIVTSSVLVAAAIFVGKTRLIDNFTFDPAHQGENP